MADNFEQAKTMNRDAAASLLEVAQDKMRAGTLPPGHDASAENVKRVKRARWADGSMKDQHTPDQ
jgi:hypothetical protein